MGFNLIDNERREKPSASEMERLALCPGSLYLGRAGKGMRNNRAQSSIDIAERGSLLHKCMEMIFKQGDASSFDVTDYESWALSFVHSEVMTAIDTFEAEFGLLPSNRIMLPEERLWHRDPVTDEEVFSGMCDLRVTWKDSTLGMMFEFKFGYNEHPLAPDNIQNTTNAVLWFVNNRLSFVRAFIVQPFCKTAENRVSFAEYDESTAESSLAIINEILATAESIQDVADLEKPGILNPGYRQCLYCPALEYCRKARGLKAAIQYIEESMTPEAMSKALEESVIAGKIIEANKALASSMMKVNPESIPGWKMTKPFEVKKTRGYTKVYEAFQEFFTAEEYSALASPPSLTAIKAHIKEKTGMKPKELNPFVDDLLESVEGCYTKTFTDGYPTQTTKSKD